MAKPFISHKDRLFRKLFGDESNKDALLSLYNALNQTSYTDPSELTINTIEDVLYMSMKNDISCILDNQMVLMEHQSTFNPNMPLRGFLYFGKLYSQYIETNSLNLYSSDQVHVPTPRYFVLYNGTQEFPDKITLHLSDAFSREDIGGNFEWTAEMININSDHNEAIMQSCQTLREYAVFTQMIRENRKTGMDIEEAVNQTVDQCIRQGILKSFLLKWKSEVIEMCITEYNQEAVMKMLEKENLEKGAYRFSFMMVNQGILPLESAAAFLNVSSETYRKKLEKYNQDPEAFQL